jgi:hypothetical protein
MKKIPEKVSMDEIRARTTGTFFGPIEMRAFSSRLPNHGYRAKDGSVYFWSSERFEYRGDNGPRLYTVRRLNPETKHIDTVGKFQRYETAASANAAARRCALSEIPS